MTESNPHLGTVFHPEAEPAGNGMTAPHGTGLVPAEAGGALAVPGRLRGLPRRRRPAMIALAVALTAVGILASVAIYARADHQVPVVVVTGNVPAGAVITAGDLGVTSVAAGPGVQVIPARQLHQVVGLVAATALRPGSLLTPSELTTRQPPGPGQVLVPVAVRPSTLPASGLAPGDQVLLVATPGAQGQSGSSSGPPVLTRPVPAVVQAASSSPNADGLDVVDLLVAAASGPSVAQQASTGQIALVVTARSPR
jgi:putative cofactor-binding repeat protein